MYVQRNKLSKVFMPQAAPKKQPCKHHKTTKDVKLSV